MKIYINAAHDTPPDEKKQQKNVKKNLLKLYILQKAKKLKNAQAKHNQRYVINKIKY